MDTFLSFPPQDLQKVLSSSSEVATGASQLLKLVSALPSDGSGTVAKAELLLSFVILHLSSVHRLMVDYALAELHTVTNNTFWVGLQEKCLWQNA